MEFSKIILLLLFVSTYGKGEINVFSGEDQFYDNLKVAFDVFGIKYQRVNRLDRLDSENLYIVRNISDVKAESLPKYYIVYQTEDLSKISLTGDLIRKLSNAVAVWDCSWSNISKYKKLARNYLYFPLNYEFADPVVLSCLLPTKTLAVYKEILIYSNSLDSDISSHLPIIFAHSVLQSPQVVVEAGVRCGGSTFAIARAVKFFRAKLMGIDIDPVCKAVYSGLDNAVFFGINDLDFPRFYKESRKPDIIFIDTSHLYEQTIEELKVFVPLLSENGILIFHDSNVTPIGGVAYKRLNNTICESGSGNTRGVTKAIKEYFNVSFDEGKYCNFNFIKGGVVWKMIHYPFCNGLTILKKALAQQI